METKSKKEYIEAWESHINQLGILAFCKDDKLATEVQKHMSSLKNLVRQIAETKDLEA